MSAAELVGLAAERRTADRRMACRHLESAPNAHGKSFDSTHVQSRVEILLVEQQAASEYAVQAISHAAAALQTLTNELRAARAAAVASNRAGHLAAGAVSGATS